MTCDELRATMKTPVASSTVALRAAMHKHVAACSDCKLYVLWRSKLAPDMPDLNRAVKGLNAMDMRDPEYVETRFGEQT